MILLIFTNSYPYDYHAEHIFISREIPYMAEQFESIFLIPRSRQGKRLSLPRGVEVVDDFAGFLEKYSRPLNWLKLAIASRYFYQEVYQQPTILLFPSKLLMLILFIARAELTRQWASIFLRSRRLDPRDCILYSYWFDHVSMGLGLLKPEFPGLQVVSRAHGYDIYEEYYYPYYWPCRRETINMLDRLFPASDAGKNHLFARHPEFQHKYETVHLGVGRQDFASRSSADGIFRIVSCSFIVPVKRLDLLLRGIAATARLRPMQSFEWVHIGDGKRRASLHKQAQRVFPSNATVKMPGYLPNEDVMRYYRENPVDAFVNLSATEGGAPVSIMEAISGAIPVIATNVGGNPEIVSERNGILLGENPTPLDVAEALLTFLDNPAKVAQWREGSRKVWQEKYDSENNLDSFARRLKAMRQTK